MDRDNPTKLMALKLEPGGTAISKNQEPTEIQIFNGKNPSTGYTCWHIQRENRHHLLYFNASHPGIFAASSAKGILGPYESQRQVVLKGKYWDPSIVKDIDGTDVLLVGTFEDPKSNTYAFSMPYAGKFKILKKNNINCIEIYMNRKRVLFSVHIICFSNRYSSS